VSAVTAPGAPRPRRGLWALAAAGAALQIGAAALLAVASWRARLDTPPPTLLVRDRGGSFLGELGSGPDAELGFWPLESTPQRVAAATLALEDRRFRWHPGVDPLAVGRAALDNLRAGRRLSGASTLAMQVARLQDPGRRTYLRKATEAATAVFLTLRYGRDGVLRQYLLLVPYGNRIHGIAYAARRYFDKPVEDLSWAQIALLAALPRSPGRMNPLLPAGRLRALRRAERILEELHRRGVTSPEEDELARRQLAELPMPARAARPPEALHALLRLERRSAPTGRPGGAPIVDSTLDLELQREASWLTHRAVAEWRDRGAGNAALVVVELPGAQVRAWVGSAGYFDQEGRGAIDYTAIRRSGGSVLKPFLYAQALDRGAITPASVLDDLGRGPGGITNSDDLFVGPLLPRAALANSRNVPAVELLARLGVDRGYAFLRQAGLGGATLPARHYGLGLAIGGLPVSLEEVARAYLALAVDGRLPELRWRRDEELPAPRRLISEDSARLVTLFLADPLARLPSFPRMGPSEYRFPVAVKTGTSSNYHDAWAVAYSPRYLVAAWVGHPDFRPMNRLSGYRAAARLAHQAIDLLHPGSDDGLADLSFPPPRGHRPARLCALTGDRAGAACDRVATEWLPPGQEPQRECRVHVLRAVDRRDGLLAHASTPPAEVEVRPFVELEPRYAAWQAAAGLPRPPSAPSPLGAAAGRAAAGEPRHARAVPAAVRLRVTAPEGGVELLRDPETPEALSTLALEAVADPPVEQVVWYVDGRPYAVADYPYSTRWPLAGGVHTIQVRLPYRREVSPPVRVVVRE
jgi:penicillin-binding protein 1C